MSASPLGQTASELPKTVYLFDAHSDLGYGGLSALSFEANCSNWLGKLLKDKQINAANIFYSPYTAEKPEHFKAMSSIYNIRYCDFYDLEKNAAMPINQRITGNADQDISSPMKQSMAVNVNQSISTCKNQKDIGDVGQAIPVHAVHICRSGAWTPPWLDNEFTRFVDALGLPYKVINCPERKWNPDNISFSDQIDYLMA